MANSESTQTLADMVQSQANSAITSSEAGQALSQFWPKSLEEIQQLTNNDLKQQELPLARIKKIMKLDDDVKMISAEAPVLFSKAAEIFIGELTLRAWIHTEDNKRRTLQRNDIAMAISKYDQFDFLIDIVPREEVKPAKTKEEKASSSVITDQVQYYLNLAQQSHQALQQLPNQQGTAIQNSGGTPQTIQIMQPGGQIQTINVMQAPQVLQQSQTVQAAPSLTVASPTPAPQQPPTQVQQQSQQIILQNSPHQASQQTGSIQIVQQIVGPNGEIQQIPIQLTPQQLQMLRMQLGQLGAGNVNQTVVVQTQQPAQQTQVIELQTTE